MHRILQFKVHHSDHPQKNSTNSRKNPKNKISLDNYQSVTPDHFSNVTIPTAKEEKKNSSNSKFQFLFLSYEQKPL